MNNELIIARADELDDEDNELIEELITYDDSLGELAGYLLQAAIVLKEAEKLHNKEDILQATRAGLMCVESGMELFEEDYIEKIISRLEKELGDLKGIEGL